MYPEAKVPIVKEADEPAHMVDCEAVGATMFTPVLVSLILTT